MTVHSREVLDEMEMDNPPALVPFQTHMKEAHPNQCAHGKLPPILPGKFCLHLGPLNFPFLLWS